MTDTDDAVRGIRIGVVVGLTLWIAILWVCLWWVM
jgi:hypothetical protein